MPVRFYRSCVRMRASASDFAQLPTLPCAGSIPNSRGSRAEELISTVGLSRKVCEHVTVTRYRVKACRGNIPRSAVRTAMPNLLRQSLPQKAVNSASVPYLKTLEGMMTERQRKTGSRILTTVIIVVSFLFIAYITVEVQREQPSQVESTK